MVPSPFLDSPRTKELPVSSCQETTDTKSATNDGIEHLRRAELPRITYSLFTSDSYCCCTTVDIKLLKGLEGIEVIECAFEITVIFAGKKVFVVGMPRDNLYEIGNERRNLTLQQNAVPQYDVLLVDVGIVCLGDHLINKQE